MAVLHLVPDLPHPGIAVEPEAEQHYLPAEPEICSHPAPARIWNSMITPPRVEPAVLIPFLRLAAELALRATGAAGCAIAMRAGSGFRCYASVGEAPPANTPVRLAGTLTGLCVRKGKTVRRNHVDPEPGAEVTGYAAHARSVVLAPIFQDGNVGGAIGIFSSEPDAFFDEHVTALEQIASVIAISLLHSDRMAATVPEDVPPAEPQAEAHVASLPAGITQEALAAHTRALEAIAHAITSTLSNPQLTAAAPAAASPSAPVQNSANEDRQSAPTNGPGPRKTLYGLPCSKCGAYFPSAQTVCHVCGTKRAGA